MMWKLRQDGRLLPMIAAYYKALGDQYRQAVQAVGEVTFHLEVGGLPVRLCFAGQALVDSVMPALAGIIRENGGTPALTIRLWDWASTGVSIPPRPWLTANGTADVSLVNDGRFLVTDQQQRYFGVDILHLYDAQEKSAFYIVPDAQKMPYWIRSFPLRILLHCWTLPQPMQLIHAAAVGFAEGGVLLAGRGGSGKSTTAVACLNSALNYAGDDYVLLRLEPEIQVCNLYSTIKIDQRSVQMLPWIQGWAANQAHLDEEKSLIYLNKYRPDKLSAGFPLKAILIPKISGGRDTEIRPATAVEALTELVPTTTLQLQRAKRVTIEKIKQVVQQVPVYTLALGSDLDQIPGAIINLLAQRGVPSHA